MAEHDTCEGCVHYLGGGCCRINMERECGDGNRELWETDIPTMYENINFDEMMSSLRDQMQDRLYLANGETDSIFSYDAKTLHMALELLEGLRR